MTEIIDLTLSPQAPETIEILSDGADSTVTSRQNASRQLKRRKSKKWKKSKGPLSDGVDSAAQSSRACTPTQCSTQIGQPSSRRSGSPPPRVATPITDESTLFFLDAAAAPVDLGMDPPNAQLGAPAKASIKLLLPSHVSVLNSGGDAVVPVEIIPSATNSDEEDYIEYLDYEYGKAPGQVRYFEVDAEDGQTKPSIFKCKNCGVEGEHKTYECLVQICLTCGARDEHSTRSCPISKICYTCGMKGHINKSCPNRFSRPTLAAGSYNDCDRCGSRDHKMNECPTLWRIYQYVNDEERMSRALLWISEACYALLVVILGCFFAISCVALLEQAVRTAPNASWTNNWDAFSIGATYFLLLLLSIAFCVKRRIAVRRRLQRVSKACDGLNASDVPRPVYEYILQEFARSCLVSYECQPRDVLHPGLGRPGTEYSGIRFRRTLLDTIADIDARAHLIIPSHPPLKPHARMLHHFRFILPLLPKDEDGLTCLHYYDSAIQLARTSQREPKEDEFLIGLQAANEIRKTLDECRIAMLEESRLELDTSRST